MHIANGLNQAFSDVYVSLARAVVRYLQRSVDVGRLPHQAQDQFKIRSPEKVEKSVYIRCEQAAVLGVIQQ